MVIVLITVDPDIQDSDGVKIFNQTDLGLFRTLTLLIDMESTDLILDFNRFSQSDQSIYRYLGFSLLLLFYFFMSLVFINLLNAYAVAKLVKIEQQAEAANRISKIETILFFEKFLQTVYKALGRCGNRAWVSGYERILIFRVAAFSKGQKLYENLSHYWGTLPTVTATK